MESPGPRWPSPCAYYDPDSCSLRTSQQSLDVDQGSMSSSLILPRSGSMRGGRVFERPTSGLPTGATGGSLLPIPDAAVSSDGEDLDNWHARRESTRERHNNGNGFGTPLAIAVRLLPVTTDARGARNRTSGRSNPDSNHHDGVTLTDAVRLLPTPTGDDANNITRASGSFTYLTREVHNLWLGESSDQRSPDGNTSPDNPHPHQPTIEDD